MVNHNFDNDFLMGHVNYEGYVTNNQRVDLELWPPGDSPKVFA